MTAPLTEDEMKAIRERARICDGTPEKYLTEPAIDRAALLKHVEAQDEALRASRDEAAQLKERNVELVEELNRILQSGRRLHYEAARLRAEIALLNCRCRGTGQIIEYTYHTDSTGCGYTTFAPVPCPQCAERALIPKTGETK
jgi:hypothetical protein